MVHQQDVVQPLRFVGQVEDTETGLYYNYHRYYNPKIGRYTQHLVKVAGYTQPDPIGLAGGINPYVYADNNPIMNVDPSGLWGIKISYYHRGIGGSINFGNKKGKNFVIANAGVGIGRGVSFDPNGDFHRPKEASSPCDSETWIGFSASAGMNIGKLNLGSTGNYGIYSANQEVIRDEWIEPYATIGQGIGIGYGINMGVRLGLSW